MLDRLSAKPDGPVLILTPTGRDAEGAIKLLRGEGIGCQDFPTLETLQLALSDEAGAVLVADEALLRADLAMLAARLEAQPLVGFDVSEFLDNALLRAPVTLYLFHLVRLMLDGRRLVCWMDEFWRLLGDAAFAAFAKDGPKTWRKLNGVMCLATQSASDVLDSEISRTLVEQTPTKIFFPNPAADHDEYVHGFGLSEREFWLIKQELDTGSRAFLVKQSHESVVCRLDLQGFDAELKVISGRKSELSRMQACIAQSSAHPDHWLPLFLPGDVPGATPTPRRDP